MENKQKKYNSTLLVISGVASVLAIYFGIKSQNLSKELDNDALKVSNELKKELNNFQNDSVLLLKYNPRNFS